MQGVREISLIILGKTVNSISHPCYGPSFRATAQINGPHNSSTMTGESRRKISNRVRLNPDRGATILGRSATGQIGTGADAGTGTTPKHKRRAGRFAEKITSHGAPPLS
jgi:hypothetical protein